uniref:Uncharacterized protein n=1 Tax=Rhizophora mucronata TaxID=61149 RepID=A0A2P2PN61_RHIMU
MVSTTIIFCHNKQTFSLQVNQLIINPYMSCLLTIFLEKQPLQDHGLFLVTLI